MSTATVHQTQTHTPRTRSERVPIGDFPHSVNWSNPRVAAILEAAAHCFSQRGFTATTLADIGRELGLRKSIVHYYFTSKKSLIQEVQSFAYGRYLQVIRSALAASSSPFGAEPGESLTAGLRSFWAALAQNDSLRGLNLELWSEGRRNGELAERAQALEEEAHQLIAAHFAGMSKANAEQASDLATLTLAILDGLTVREEREGSSERTSRAFEAYLRLLEE